MKKSFIISILFLMLSSVVSALTLDDMISDLRKKIGDAKTDPNNQHWSSGTLTARINIIQDEIVNETLCLEARISTPTVTGQREYRYNDDVIAPLRVAYYIENSNPPAYKRMEWYSMSALDTDPTEWENLDNDLPTKYYERGNKIYGISPSPSSVYASTYAIQIDYYKKPVQLSSGTDIPFDNDTSLYMYHYLIVKGVIIMCLEDDKIDTSGLKTEYWALVTKMKDDMRNKRDTGVWKR